MSSDAYEVTISIDIGKYFTCPCCADIIETSNMYRSCIDCGQTICRKCEEQLDKIKCPLCRSAKGFASNKIVNDIIFPKISTSCIYVKCGKKYITGSNHLSSCAYRPINCPICNDSTSPVDLYRHITSDEKIKWMRFSADKLTNAINACINENKRICINLSENITNTKRNDSNRVLYIWQTDDNMLNLFCYERNLSNQITLRITMSSSQNIDDNRNLGIQVCSKDNIDARSIRKISKDDIMQYNEFSIGMGSHLFKVNCIYDVMDEQGDWNISRVVDVIENPMRVVFVTDDVRAKIVIINLDSSESHKKIRQAPPANNSSRNTVHIGVSPNLNQAISALISSISDS